MHWKTSEIQSERKRKKSLPTGLAEQGETAVTKLPTREEHITWWFAMETSSDKNWRSSHFTQTNSKPEERAFERISLLFFSLLQRYDTSKSEYNKKRVIEIMTVFKTTNICPNFSRTDIDIDTPQLCYSASLPIIFRLLFLPFWTVGLIQRLRKFHFII